MSNQGVVDMLDRNDSTRVKLRLAARRREADSLEEAAAERAREVLQPPPSSPDGDVPLGGYLLMRASAAARSPHSHRALHVRKEAREPGQLPSFPGVRALPSGPALNPTGFAIALLLLGIIALVLGLGAIAWIAWSLVASIRNLFTGQEGNG